MYSDMVIKGQLVTTLCTKSGFSVHISNLSRQNGATEVFKETAVAFLLYWDFVPAELSESDSYYES